MFVALLVSNEFKNDEKSLFEKGGGREKEREGEGEEERERERKRERKSLPRVI